MSLNINGEQKLGEIVASCPGASDVFINNKIDFCCGGNRSLNEAAADAKVDTNKVMQEIDKKYEELKNQSQEHVDWTVKSSSELIEYIVAKHHGYLRNELPKLSELVFKILKVHFHHSGELLLKIHRHFNNLRTELEEHIVKEEEIIFPLFREYDQNKTEELKNKIKQSVEELESEHDGAGNILKEMSRLTSEYAIPKEACKTFELTYTKLSELEKDLFQHIHLENNILFKRTK